ncbi:MAG: GNAT family N-acetyltransferase [bacterium]|nr:GNAT family N-acetyltransferase [bacterium]
MNKDAADNQGKYQTEVILKDGSTLQLRPLRPEDTDRLRSSSGSSENDSVYQKFQKTLAQLKKEPLPPTGQIDADRTFALVATLGVEGEEKIVAVGRYVRKAEKDLAEVAFTVEDEYRGKGIGTILLKQLADIAREKGIRLFEGYLLGKNPEALKELKSIGVALETESEKVEYQFVLKLAPALSAENRLSELERVSNLVSLKAILAPKSIAVVSASGPEGLPAGGEGALGRTILRNLTEQGFRGSVYAVNPAGEADASLKTYKSVLDIPGKVDLAVITVPAEAVREAVEQCGRKEIRGAVVISGGFGEKNPDVKNREKELADLARRYDLRLLGPDCAGVINTDFFVNMNATFSSYFPPPGQIALASQNGALGLAMLKYIEDQHLGLSSFVNLGDRAEVSSNDLLQYWEEDPATKVVLLYLDSFGNPRKFTRVARRATQVKPVVAVKSGRVPAGPRTVPSYTAALAQDHVAPDQLFRQTGIIRADKLEESFDIANLLSHQPIPPGKRVVILSNSEGPGVLTADACAAKGLEMAEITNRTQSELARVLPDGAGLFNPINLTAGASADKYRQVLRLLAKDDHLDVAIVIHIPPVGTHPAEVAQAIQEVAPQFRWLGKTLVASFMNSLNTPTRLGSPDEGYVPCFAFPETTATALAKACEYGDFLKKTPGMIPALPGIDRKKAEDIIRAAREKNRDRLFRLDHDSVQELLQAYGIRASRSARVRTLEEALAAARKLGFPVKLKPILTPNILKPGSALVIRELQNEEELGNTYRDILSNLKSDGKETPEMIVQEMIPEGFEIIAGVTQDASFGPLVMFGMGGIFAETFKDVVFRVHPLTDTDAREAVRSVKTYQFLKGWWGLKPLDIEALVDLLLRISAMVEDLPAIAEMDLKPVKVLEEGQGYMVLDAQILIS